MFDRYRRRTLRYWNHISFVQETAVPELDLARLRSGRCHLSLRSHSKLRERRCGVTRLAIQLELISPPLSSSAPAAYRASCEIKKKSPAEAGAMKYHLANV